MRERPLTNGPSRSFPSIEPFRLPHIMLIRYLSNAGTYSFVDDPSRRRWQHQRENTFTVIVGKNGTGKSRLLSAVVVDLIRQQGESESFDRRERRDFHHRGEVEATHLPNRVICVSTSPFDRFPLPNRQSASTYYSYLGLRGLISQNLGAAYLSRVMAMLLNAIYERPAQAEALAHVLKYLSYEPLIEATFQLAPASLLDALAAADSPGEALEHHFRRAFMPGRDTTQPLRQLVELPQDEYRHLLSVALDLHRARASRLRVAITPRGIEFVDGLYDFRLDFVKLARYGLIRLRDAKFFKTDHYSAPTSINELSSGEQAVMMGLLGIGSQICDGAVICIDEPEVCLHPEWQERYIELLFQTFSIYRGCHFLIATHSPQVVSRLPLGDCHVMQMDTGIAQGGDDYSGRSIDFQLAQVFKAPGYRNEYLARIALNVFARATQSKSFDQEASADLRMLKEAMNHTRNDDPLHELVAALTTMQASYG